MININHFIYATYPQCPAVSRVALSSGMQNKSLPHDKCLRAIATGTPRGQVCTAIYDRGVSINTTISYTTILSGASLSHCLYFSHV